MRFVHHRKGRESFIFQFSEFVFNRIYANRNDITERLQGVMEAQWKKTLEILATNEPKTSLIDPKTKQFLEELSHIGGEDNEHSDKLNFRFLLKDSSEQLKSSKPRRLNNIDMD